MKMKKTLFVLLASLLTLALGAACGNVGEEGGGGPSGSGDGSAIIVGSKNFTEQYVLGELYAQALEAKGLNVETKLDLGSAQIADKALRSGQIDIYPEYTGTALVDVLGYDGKNPETPKATYQEAKKLYEDRKPATTMLKPANFNNTYGIFVTRKVAEEKNLKTMADLAEASPDLTFVAFTEFLSRPDSYPNMKKNYPAFNWKDTFTVNSIGGPIYQGVRQGEGEVGVGFTTDAQLASNDLVVMEDPKSIWPFYYPGPVVRSDVLKKHPKIETVLDSVNETLDADTMRKLNAQVAIEQEDPEDVAQEYLEKEGLLK
jgi:osmoprotectant transport system substrate-binding protein